MSDYAIQRMVMISASAEAEARRYHRVKGKDSRIYLYADQENPGDNIYVEGGSGSDGFGAGS